MENWKPIKGDYNCNYEVSNLGRVRNHDTGTILKPNFRKDKGYLTVTLRRSKSKLKPSLSHLVANAFVPNPNNDLYVGFKDGNKENVLPFNLYWYSYNKMRKGDVYGNFTIIKDLGIINGTHKVRVSCICGDIKEYTYSKINKNRVKSCGCLLPDITPLDINEINKRDLGDWTVVEELFFHRRKNGAIQRKVLMRCKCGYKKKVNYSNIKISKACYKCAIKKIRSRLTDEERKNIDLLRSRFCAMKQRCYDPNNKSYSCYGAKGITICDEWLEKPKRFVDWALDNGFERHLELDRKKSNKGYSPDNCQFISKQENALKNNLINLTPEDVYWIRSKEYSLKKALKKFDCSKETITNIREGKTFTSI
jgi:hypothetical protein